MAPPKPKRIRGGWSVRIRYGADQRGRFRLPDMPEAEAADRALRLERMARALAAAGFRAKARALLDDAASQRSAKHFAVSEAKAAEVAAEAGTPIELRVKTFRDVCEMFWSGELHRLAPDRVPRIAPKTMATARARLERLCATVGEVPLTRFTIDVAERALAALPPRSASTRRGYANRIGHMLRLASIPPLNIIERSPLPPRWAPRRSVSKAYSFIYPTEDKQLLRCVDVEIEHRWLWGFLAREGCRLSEALALKWSDIDLELGVIRLDRNKTSSPRLWRIGHDVTRALQHKRHAACGQEAMSC